MRAASRPCGNLITQLRVLSSVPGRASFRFPPVRRQRPLALGIEAAVRQLHGVRSVRANPLTARILVEFDPTRVPLAEIAATVAGARPEGRAGVIKSPVDEAAADLRGFRRRLVVGGAVLTGLLLKRAIFGAAALSGGPVLAGITTAATLVSAYPFLRGGLRTLTGRSRLDTDALVTTGTIATLLLGESVTALTVIWFLNLGEMLQAIALRRVQRSIAGLVTAGSEQVWLVVDGAEVGVPRETVELGDTVAVYAGDTIPVDGDVVEGAAAVDEAPLTGESIPAYKNRGDGVLAGTMLVSGSLRVRAARVGVATAVGRQLARIEQARELRGPIETIGERFSRRFVPFSFALSLGVLALTRDVRRAMTMLVIACPCAAGLSTPTAVSAAIGNAARRGVLIKGGVQLEAAAGIDTVVFDRTTALTTGPARVTRVLSLDPAYSPQEVLRIAASGELHSTDPLALTVVRHTRALEIEIPEHEECEVIVGRGMRADMGGNRILVGSEGLLHEFGVALPDGLPAELAGFRGQGETALCVAVNGGLFGLVGLKRLVRPETREAIESLRRAGIHRIIICTDESPGAAEITAHDLGLCELRGEVSRDDKLALIRGLRAAGHRVAMVGDGIDDAPALALADLGIALGTSGCDAAVESADVALAGGDLRGVATVLDLSRRALSVVRQNYGLALGVNAAGLLVGATGAISPVLAALLHSASTIAVTLNSSRLIGYRPAGIHDCADERVRRGRDRTGGPCGPAD